MQQPARVESVGDEAELEPARPQRLQQRRRVGRELPRRIPGRVLGLEEPRQLVVVDVDPKIAEQLAH